MLEPTGEKEAGTGQLVGLVQVAEPWLAATVVAHSSARLAFLNVPSCVRNITKIPLISPNFSYLS